MGDATDIRIGEATFSALYGAARDAIMLRTLDRRIVAANLAAVRLFGCQDEAELTSLTPVDIYPEYQPDGRLSAEKAPEPMAIAMRDGSCSFEWEYRRCDGTGFLGSVVATRIELQGQAFVLSTIHDITESRLSQQAIHESEQRFMDVWLASSEAMLLSSGSEFFVNCNDAAARMLGYPDRETLLRTPLEKLMPPQQPDGRKSLEEGREMGAIAIRNGSHRFEMIHRKASGEDIPIDVSLTATVMHGQNLVVCVWRDITEQKRAQKELQESKQRLATIIDFLPDGTFAIDREGRIIAWNRAIEKLSGVPASEMLGKGDYAYAVPLYGERRPIMIDFLFGGHEELWKGFDYIERKGDQLVAERFVPGFYGGKGAYIWGITAPLYDSDGQIVGAIESFRDITEQKQAQAALQANVTKYRTLFNASLDAFLLRTPDRRIISANPAAIALFGCNDEAELMSASLSQLYPERQPDGSLSEEKAFEMIGIAKREGSHIFEWRYNRVDGTPFDATVALTIMSLNGEQLLLTTVHDITKQKRAEETLRASETKYKTLYDASSDAILLRTPDRRVVGANPAAVALFGCKDEAELKALMPSDLYAEYQPDGHLSSEKAPEMVQIALRDGSYSFEWRYRRRDGTEFLANVLWTRMELAEGMILLTTIRDITQQRQVEEALRASERRLRLFADNVTDVIWNTDLTGRFTYISPSNELLFGFKWREDLHLTIRDFVAPASLPIAEENLLQLAAAAQNGQRLRMTEELELLRADGSTVWGEVTASGAFDEAGQLVGFLGITHDITERRQAEESLRASQAQYKTLFDVSHDAILLLGDSGAICANHAAAVLFGYEKESDLVSITAVDTSPEFQPDGSLSAVKAEEMIDTAMRRGTHAFTWLAKRPDGTEFFTEVTLTKMELEGKSVLLVTNRDITERLLAEQRQATSLRRLEGVNRLHEDLLLPGSLTDKFAKIAAAAVELLDLDFCRIWLLRPGDLCRNGCLHGGEPPSEACPRQDQCLHLLASSGRYTHIDGNHRRVPLGALKIGHIASGKRNKFLTNEVISDPEIGDHQWAKDLGLVAFAGYKLRDMAGCPTGVLAMFAKHPFSEEDDAFMATLAETTSRVIIDAFIADALRQSQAQAVEANLAKSRFLATMSHEIRTPMTAILGYADLLTDPTVSPSVRDTYAHTIRRSGEHLLALINDILDLSKIEAGKMTVDIGPSNLVAMLADVTSIVHPRAKQRGLAFSVEYVGDIPETIQTDNSRLRQAVINLAGNAVKFTEKGSVRIVTTFLPDGIAGQPAVQIEVIDTGIGIAEDVVPKLFQPFSQGDARVSQTFGGTGLGLAISRHLARLLGGDLTVRSAAGEGSTFTLTIPTGDIEGVPMLHSPADIVRETLEHPWIDTAKYLQGVRILLAEDGFDNRELIQAILEKVGADVETAENGRVAVAKAESGEFDIVLMDMNMPEMDGYEATSLLRRQGYQTPILALTANAMSGDADRCLMIGCNEHLPKPIDRRRLIQRIAAHVNREIVEEEPAPEPKQAASPGIISTFVDDPDMTAIIGRFIERLPRQVTGMRDALATARFEDLRRMAHILKGSGGSYGYPMLTEAAKVLENAASLQDGGNSQAAIDAVATIVRAIQQGHMPEMAESVAKE